MNDAREIGDLLDILAGASGATLAAPAPAREVERVESFAGALLPAAHRSLLLRANGLAACWGFWRLLGVGDGPEDIGPWNAHETWKFAWPQQLEDFLAIGQSGWGDQFCYRLSDLRRGVETIHRLDHFLMEKSDEPVAEDFVSFVRDLVTRAQAPEERIVEARRQIGDLGPGQLAVFTPSPLLVGLERATHMMKMHSRVAMVTNGDLTTQLVDPANESRRVHRIESYMDDRGRHRIHIKWIWSPKPRKAGKGAEAEDLAGAEAGEAWDTPPEGQ